MKLKLTIEPIAPNNWYKSLANMLPRPVWDAFRRERYSESGYRCVICNAENVEVHCHEVWIYDDRKHVQILRGFQCICAKCHAVKHWGRTVKEVHNKKLPASYLKDLTFHFCAVNECSPLDFDHHKAEVGTLMDKRRKRDYKIDFGKFHPDKVTESWRKVQRSRR